ncbi:CG18186 [Drosophila busckii]|uniref:CG18186 n=1 Tax=Drosophila busckii TaxID=30019 RepID=A0A0M4E7A9_DROBS|nr:CG18186 [Drosophila busckii]
MENLSCPNLIDEFEKLAKERSYGFDRGLVPSKIIGATEKSGQIWFLMAWKNQAAYEYVPADLAQSLCCSLVIQFYKERSFSTPNDAP